MKKTAALLLVLILCLVSVGASAEKIVLRNGTWSDPSVISSGEYVIETSFTTAQAGDLYTDTSTGEYYLPFEATLLYGNTRITSYAMRAYATGTVTADYQFVFRADLRFRLPLGCRPGTYIIRLEDYVPAEHGGPYTERAEVRFTIGGSDPGQNPPSPAPLTPEDPVIPEDDPYIYRPNPRSHPVAEGVVLPYAWDTEFRPDNKVSEYNLKRYERLPNICDDNRGTTFEWLIYSGERTDSIPELTAIFRGDTIRAIGIRNGNLKSADEYFYYSRATAFKLRIVDIYGNVQTEELNIPDQYNPEYQVFRLSQAYENVRRIEFFLDGFNFDINNTRAGKYLLYIADIQFYSDLY